MTRPPFARTICNCREELQNCQRMPGYLGPGDVERIAAHFGLTVDEACAELFEEGRGAVVANSATMIKRKIRTLRPRLLEDGCIFLEGRRCMIHAIAPFGCAYFDVHMSKAEADTRSAWALRLIMDDDTYAVQVALAAKGKV